MEVRLQSVQWEGDPLDQLLLGLRQQLSTAVALGNPAQRRSAHLMLYGGAADRALSLGSLGSGLQIHELEPELHEERGVLWILEAVVQHRREQVDLARIVKHLAVVSDRRRTGFGIEEHAAAGHGVEPHQPRIHPRLGAPPATWLARHAINGTARPPRIT